MVDTFLCKNDIELFLQLKLQDAALADTTLNMQLAHFMVLFRGSPQHEWPHSHVWNILCLNLVAQPYKLNSIGLVLIALDAILYEDEHPLFRVFINISLLQIRRKEGQYHYIRDYSDF